MGGDDIDLTAVVRDGDLQRRAGELRDDPDVAAAIEFTDDDPGGESELGDLLGQGHRSDAREERHPVPAGVGRRRDLLKAKPRGQRVQGRQVEDLLQCDHIGVKGLQDGDDEIDLVGKDGTTGSEVLHVPRRDGDWHGSPARRSG